MNTEMIGLLVAGGMFALGWYARGSAGELPAGVAELIAERLRRRKAARAKAELDDLLAPETPAAAPAAPDKTP